jgi:hypothetical protein
MSNFSEDKEHKEQLSLSIKEIPVLYKFKRTLKAFLLDDCFYSVDEFLLFGA